MYTRTGVCQKCGECCGYPNAVNGSQIDVWPPHMRSDVRSWTIDYIREKFPLFQLTGHPDLGGKEYDSYLLSNGWRIRYIWRNGTLVTDTPRYGDVATYDKRCPCLMAKQADGTVPCALKGTQFENIWNVLCSPVPPVQVQDAYWERFIADWQVNCPSCSYTWTYQAG